MLSNFFTMWPLKFSLLWHAIGCILQIKCTEKLLQRIGGLDQCQAILDSQHCVIAVSALLVFFHKSNKFVDQEQIEQADIIMIFGRWFSNFPFISSLCYRCTLFATRPSMGHIVLNVSIRMTVVYEIDAPESWIVRHFIPLQHPEIGWLRW